MEWAAGEAVLRGRSLRIVHAVERWPFRVPLLAPSDGAVEEGKAILEAARAAVRERWRDLGVTTALVEEETEKALREESKDAFALVLGRRGRGGFAGMPLGSTSRRMASESSVPVVIVRGEASEGGEVVVGVDLSWDSELVLEHAFETAALYGARLRAVHAWMVYGMPVESGAVFDEEAVHDELLGRVVAAHEPLREKYPHVDVVEDVVMAHPVTALTEASRGARLLVVGADHHHWDAFRLGSVAHGAVHHAECPVTVVPYGLNGDR